MANIPILQKVKNLPTVLSTYRFLKKSQHWNTEQLETYQLQQLKKLLHHAYAHVPYYKKTFTEHHLHPDNITKLQDLQTLPFLTKDQVRNNLPLLKATNYPPASFEPFYTGGSTGQPLQFYIEKDKYFATMMAYGMTQNQWTHHHNYDRSAIILGQPQLFNYSRLGRTLSISSFNMTEKDLPRILEKINALRPTYLLGYPSSLTRLAHYITTNNQSYPDTIHTIVSIAETLYPWQRTLIEQTFHSTVQEQYCQRESVAFGLQCTQSTSFHMFPQFGITELINTDGTPIHKEDEIGEIVGTSLHNTVFPFIRYRTGDIGVYTTHHCPCGISYPLIKKIQGRTQDYVLSTTQQPFFLTGIYDLIAKTTTHLQDYQFYQDTPGELILNIIKTPSFTNQDQQKIHQNFQNLIGDRLRLTIRYVDHITLTSSGKTLFLIQKIPVKHLPIFPPHD